MSSETIRIFAALAIVAVLAAQAYQARTNPRRRQALSVLAGALLAFTGYNALVLAGDASILPRISLGVGIALMIAGIVLFVRSFDRNEIAARRAKYQAELARERQRREDAVARHEDRNK